MEIGIRLVCVSDLYSKHKAWRYKSYGKRSRKLVMTLNLVVLCICKPKTR